MYKMITLLAITLLPLSVLANGDVSEGQKKSIACASCHGAKGFSPIGMYPNLAGQNEAYLIAAINAYKSGDRKGQQATIMKGMVGYLSDTDIKNLAAYYSKLPTNK